MDTKSQAALFTKKDKKTQHNMYWKILIVDDEEDVHTMTNTVLSNFSFENKKLQFFHAYNTKEAIEIMSIESDIALIFLDVVMEEEDSGLKIIKIIREKLNNHLVRIILRTGQPGSAPEESVILNYDINDYKEKTELTSTKLFTTIVSALRSFKSLQSLERGKDGLKLIIEASGELFKIHSLQKFTSGILTQIMPILNFNHDSMYLQADGFTAQKSDGHFKILAGTGQFDLSKSNTQPKISNEVMVMLEEAMKNEKSIFKESTFVGFISLRSGIKHFIYIKSNREITIKDRELVELFLKNISIAFENIYFDEKIIDIKNNLIDICSDFTHKFKLITNKNS